MNEAVAYILSRLFYYGMFVTPVISFFIVRNTKVRMGFKILTGALITILIGMLFLLISMLLFLNSGKVT